ncbi:TPA: hypothetical protein N0F65_004048 [Lagenidium giganteum]|uniref:HECT domain-containing protein n=1 Tax=Lagenidium giganteum TaxID=4803 RepID=A0AAV2YZB4_9STRA|nr:TPA: hypothetical protein N0F65_004048 [Lagenidium giganteum]
MGADMSKASAALDDDADAHNEFGEKLSARAWREGVPFTLLHDEAFVAEKYRELMAARGQASSPRGALVEDEDVSVSGTNDVPLDELQQVADGARVKLFGQPSRAEQPLVGGVSDDPDASGRTGPGTPGAQGKRANQANGSGTAGGNDRRISASALAGIADTALSRPTVECVMNEKLRTQRVEIIQNYFEQLVAMLESHGSSGARNRARSRSLTAAASAGLSRVEVENIDLVAAGVVAPESSKRPHRATVPNGNASLLFSLSAFRVQLEMLHDFRRTSPRVFRRSVLAMIKSTLEFSPFLLRDVAPGSTEELALMDHLCFCQEVLAGPETTAEQHNITLVLLLALGVSSGRLALVLRFVHGLVRVRTSKAGAQLLQNEELRLLVREVLERMDEYRVKSKLSAFEDATLLRRFTIKTLQAASIDPAHDFRLSLLPQSNTSISTDGSYLYTWNLQRGLMKVGTGLNFTIAGRVYAEAPSASFLKLLQKRPVYNAVLYGEGRDVTSAVSEYMKGLQSDRATPKLVKDILTKDDADDILASFSHRKVFVAYSVNGVRTERIFSDDDLLQISTRADVVVVLFAFYGDFENLGYDFLSGLSTKLEEIEASAPEDGELLLTSSLLAELTDGLSMPILVSADKKLILVSSSHGSNVDTALCVRLGQPISCTDDVTDKVYLSSVALCDCWLYLSILVMEDDNTPVLGRSESAHRVIRVSPKTLTAVDTLELKARAHSQAPAPPLRLSSPMPLFTLVSDGKRMYEVEMSTNSFDVNVFIPTSASDGGVALCFERRFGLDIENVQCSTFVNCLLKILKAKIQVTAPTFTLPTFYTNGSILCAYLPSTSASISESPKYNCLMFDCEEGKYCEPETSVPTSAKTNDDGFDSFEREIAGPAACFDAKTNVIWTLDASKNTVACYKNCGERISSSVDIISLQASVDVECASEDGVAHRILVSLLRNMSSLGSDSRLTSAEKSNAPFVGDLDTDGFDILLELVQVLALKYQEKANTSANDAQTLQACLLILKTNIELLIRSTDRTRKDQVTHRVRAKLQKPLEDLIARVSNDTNAQSASDGQVELLASALDLQAVSMHSDTSKQLDTVSDLLANWQSKQISKVELKVLVRLLTTLCSRVQQVHECIEAEGSKSTRLVRLIELGVSIQINQLNQSVSKRRASLPSASISPDGEEASVQLVTFVNCLIQKVLATFSMSNVTKNRVCATVSVYEAALGACTTICSAAVELVEKHGSSCFDNLLKTLQWGFLGVIAPVVLGCGLVFMRNLDLNVGRIKNAYQDERDQSLANNRVHSMLFELMKQHAEKLKELVKSMDVLVSFLDPSVREREVESVSVTKRVDTVESSHSYENNLDEINELRIPGASKLTITFDAQSRTEFNYDYITFYKTRDQTEYYGEQFYSGRDLEHNWPGVGGNPPLVIDADHCFVFFHTDSSNTDWGFKFTAVGEILQEKKTLQLHWIAFIQESAVNLLDETVKSFVEASTFAPMEEIEVLNDKFLQSDLIKSGICAEHNQNTNVVDLLKDFVDPPEGSQAERVIQALHERSGTIRLRSISSTSFTSSAAPPSTTTQSINSAVRAVAAAILHHNMWGMDAYAFAQNLRGDVSEQLMRGWKNAQKMRDWFHLGDAADASIHRSISPSRRRSRKLRRQPSAFKGVSEESLQILCTNVIERAKFLLELTPASFSYVSGAKRRWGLLVKYGYAIGRSNPAESPLEKWYNLLDELQAATELRSLFQYRRSSFERMKSGQAKSVTEQVLEFIQSDADVDELKRIISARNMRARARTFGIETLVASLQHCSYPRLRCVLVESFATTLKKLSLPAALLQVLANGGTSAANLTALSSQRVHFDSRLSGCNEEYRRGLSGAFGDCLSLFAQLLMALDSSESTLTVVILKCCALDYDVDDSYLLHDSRILTQILRLLSSESVRVRRSAQSLLGVFLSRFVVGKAASSLEAGDSRDGDIYDVSAFQKQLFTAVGLQLEGVVSLTSGGDMPAEVAYDPLKVSYLPDHSPGLTAPHMQSIGVQWNHTIMLWVYCPSSSCCYALKVGDEVRRGPDWKDGNDEDGGDREVGIVTAICSSRTVEVRWVASNTAFEYVFDPKADIYEVILLDEGVGGTIFFKGNKNLTQGTALATPWSYFALFMNDKRQLSYKIACGAEKDTIYHTNHELEPDTWTHVAIVQEEDALKFYIDGSLSTQQLLDPFLIMRGNVNPSQSRIVESVHPYSDSVDQYWPVHVPGAKKLRITFDPLCDIDRSTGFVRFYKNARCNEFWGDERYSGKYHDPERNFPGAQSHRYRGRRMGVNAPVTVVDAVEILADKCLVYFHSDGHSTGWGFRLLVSPVFPDESDSSGTTLNPYPFYFGEGPLRIYDDAAAKCWVYAPKVLDFPIAENDLISEIHADSPANVVTPVRVPNERILHILGLIRTCSETAFGRNLISTPENIGNMLFLAFDTRVSVETRCGSMRVLRDLSSFLNPKIVEVQFRRMFPRAGTTFMEFVLDSLADMMNVWSRYAQDQPVNALALQPEDATEGQLDIRESAQGAASLMSSCISLLRGLVGSFNWNELLFTAMEKSVTSLQNLLQKNIHEVDAHQLGRDIATFALFGGSYDGVALGGRVKCFVNIDGKETIETGYLVQLRIRQTVRLARILFDCDPSRPVDVPVSDVAHLSQEDDHELAHFLKHMSPFASRIRDLFEAGLQIQANNPTDKGVYKPKRSRKEIVEVLESEHPYVGGEDITYPLDFRGANEIVIYFDKNSTTANCNDFVRFNKRRTDRGTDDSTESLEFWGEEKYFGDSFPGVGNVPPLRIPASSVDVYFHTESTPNTNSEWGFKLTAHAFEETVTYPPELPPSIIVNAVNDLRARCVKALGVLFRLQHDQESINAYAPLISSLTKIANAPNDGRPTRSAPKSQVFESKHPYANSLLEYMAVTFSGASNLVITFDPQCRTEHGCDYLCFFKDKSLTDRWGAYQYSGCDDTANWPGTGGRPPLIIPSDSFTLLWCTDTSNVDWGWKFTVSAEFSSVSPLALTLEQLDRQAYHMYEVMYEKQRAQRCPYPAEFEGFEKIDAAQANDYGFVGEPIRKLLTSSSSRGELARRKTITKLSRQRKRYRVINDNKVCIRKDKRDDAPTVRQLKIGEEFDAAEADEEWLRLDDPDAKSSDVGWVRHRSGDSVYALSIAAIMQREDLMVLGVDDSHLEFTQSVLEMDESNPEYEALACFNSQFSNEGLKGQSDRFQSLTYDTHRALATKGAREALLTFLSCDPHRTPVRMMDFGTVDNLLLLFSQYFCLEKTHLAFDGQSDVLLALGKRLHAFFDDTANEATTMDMLQRCVDIFHCATSQLPRARGASRVIESAHPYHDNLDQYWQLSIPGAIKIKVMFDPRSKTETGCDWVCFYKDGSNRSELYGETQYGGRGGSENFPGCGGRPPLIIDADRFEVHFHSDSNQSDWGFKLYAVGIFETESAAGEADGPKGEDIAGFVSLLHMCCWILITLSNKPDITQRQYESLFSTDMLEALLLGLQEFPQIIKRHVFQLITNMATKTSYFRELPAPAIERIRDTINVKLRAQYAAEDRVDSKSHYLQALVQCALAIDLAIDSTWYADYRGLLSPENKFTSTQMIQEMTPPGCPFQRCWRSGTSCSSGIHTFTIRMSENAHFEGLGIFVGNSQQQGQKLEVAWNGTSAWIGNVPVSDSKWVPSRLTSEDVITVGVDLKYSTVVVRKNQLTVVTLVGRAGTDALLSWQSFSPKSELSLAVATSKPKSPIVRTWRCSPLAEIPPPTSPGWLYKIVDAASIMLDFQENRISQCVARESKHPLVRDDEVTWERVHVPGAVALEVRFDQRTALGSSHVVTISDGPSHKDGQQFALTAMKGTKLCAKNPSLFVSDASRRNVLLRTGDLVVRSADWDYGNEDGGPGSIGVVTEIVVGGGVRVRWKVSGKETIYRYSYNSRYDVQPLEKSDPTCGPLVVFGDALYFDVKVGNQDADPAETVEFQGSACVSSPIALKFDLRKSRLSFGDDYCIELWACVSEFHSKGANVPDLLHLTDQNNIFKLSIDIDGTDHAVVSAGSSGKMIPLTCDVHDHTMKMPVGGWVHLAVVASGSRCIVYLNGDVAFSGCLKTSDNRSSFLLGNLSISSGSRGVVSHVSDVRLWDVAFQSEHIQSHAKGMNSIVRDESSGGSRPGTPAKTTMAVPSSVYPPSPPRSPRLSASMAPIASKKWTTINRSGKDLVNVRFVGSVDVNKLDHANKVFYYEVGVLSGGKVSVGWLRSGVNPGAGVSVGEIEGSYAIDLLQKKAHFQGSDRDLGAYTSASSGLGSPRGSASRSSLFGEPGVRSGDTLGCAFVVSEKRMIFYINGINVAETRIGSSGGRTEVKASSAADQQKEFDDLVEEMLSIGFSRKVSTEAVEASGADNIENAVDWLLDATVREADASGESSRSPRTSRVSTTMSPPASPHRVALSPRKKKILGGVSSFRAFSDSLESCYTPCATLGAQGAQGLAWNFGDKPFRYQPTDLPGELVPMLDVQRAVETEQDEVSFFEVFDPIDRVWERCKYRHKLQDITPVLVGWWKLDEGTGTALTDASGNQQVGSAQPYARRGASHPDGLPAPPARVDDKHLWDRQVIPPVCSQPLTTGSSRSQTSSEESSWGYKFFVIPHFTHESISRSRFKTQAPRFADSFVGLLPRHDQQLVKYVNKAVQSKRLNLTQLLRVSWSEIAPNEDELVRWPVLVEMTRSLSESSGNSASSTLSVPTTAHESSQDRIAKRFKILQEYNSSINRLFPLIGFRAVAPKSTKFQSPLTLSALVADQRFRIFNLVKCNMWEDALERTNENGVSFELTLNRPKAMRHRSCNTPDWDGRYALFSQAFRQINSLDGAHFRRKDNIYYVRFLGENAEDAGGPYRETFAQYCEELHSSQLPLLLPTCNSQHNVGAGREKWVLNPGATSPTLLQMYEFLGKLMGVAVRSKQYLALNISTLIWKKLVGENVTVDDLAAIDSMVVNSMKKMRTIDRYGVTEEMFEDIVMETFTTLSSDNRLVALKAHGNSIPVTFSSRCEYADLVEKYRLQEFDTQVNALFQGFSKVLPTKLLSMFTGSELEAMVCGTPEIDVDLLEKCTEYSSCSATDEHIVWFWQVLRNFSHEERSAFLRFVWGRSRLPATEKDFPQLFKLQSFNKAQPGRNLDGYLPIAHTCFFAVEVPRYSSAEVLKDKLLYAIYNCQEIDADGDSVAANQLGWEE